MKLVSKRSLISKKSKMRNYILFIVMMISGLLFSQDTFVKPITRVFAFTPKQNGIEKVNGMAFGLGIDAFNEGTILKVNGLNLEVNPVSFLYFLFAGPSEFSVEAAFVVNGLHLSTGNRQEGKINGLCISFLNMNHAVNGLSLNLAYNYATELNGIHLSSFANSSESAKGLFFAMSNHSKVTNGFQLGVFNKSEVLKGIQLGVLNKSKDIKGIQIGLVNLTNKGKGLQLGFWNVNDKRSMPIINW